MAFIAFLQGRKDDSRTPSHRLVGNKKPRELTGDDIATVEALSTRDGARLRGLVGGYELLFARLGIADEGSPYGQGLDLYASALLPGRASREGGALRARAATRPRPRVRLLSGGALAGRDGDRAAFLRELHASYLFKDILEMGGIRQPRKLADLVRLLAFQVSSEVSFNELGTSLGMSKDSVASYIDLLEKAFIVFRLQVFSRNLRSEVTRSSKIYFLDGGVRNAAIGDFRPLADRQDKGALWDNFII